MQNGSGMREAPVGLAAWSTWDARTLPSGVEGFPF